MLCSDGTLVALDAEGSVVSRPDLGGPAAEVDAAPLALDDGTLIVALDEELVRVSARGAFVARARLPVGERLVGGIVPYDGGILGFTSRGLVITWRAPLDVRLLGSLGGPAPSGPILLGRRAVAAVVFDSRLVTFDPVTRELKTLAVADAEGSAPFEGSPTVNSSGHLLLTTAAGTLIRVSPTGDAEVLAELDGAPEPSDSASGTSSRRARQPSSPPAIVDSRGVVASLRQRGGLVLIEPSEQRLRLANVGPCPRPVAIVPAGASSLLLACGNGSLAKWADR